jgi:hypothetical protein
VFCVVLHAEDKPIEELESKLDSFSITYAHYSVLIFDFNFEIAITDAAIITEEFSFRKQFLKLES